MIRPVTKAPQYEMKKLPLCALLIAAGTLAHGEDELEISAEPHNGVDHSKAMCCTILSTRAQIIGLKGSFRENFFVHGKY